MKTLNRSVDRREDSIKKKLTAAIAMLLVSCIMVVTSTYAWFTLSTAPEVTGIHTNIAGNGNLEIALANKTTWTSLEPATLSGASDSLTTTNESWGNLVKIDAASYGTNFLTLSPAALTYADPTTKTKLSDNILSVPKYGADGRVESLTTAVLSAIYNGSSFTKNDTADYGLRALGISSKMTERQSSFNSALLSINNNKNLASSYASKALETYGGTLATVAVNVAAASNRDTVVITASEVSAIKSLITELQTSVNYIDTAIVSAIKTYLAGSDNQTAINDATYKLIDAALNNLSVLDNDQISVSGNEITFVYSTGVEPQKVTNADFADLITKVRAIDVKLSSAYATLNAISEDTTYGDIESVFATLMNMSGDIKVAGSPLNTIKQNLKDENGKINTTYAMQLAQNCTIELGENSGVFYDISSLAGTIKAGINFDINYEDIISLEQHPATITSTNEPNADKKTPTLYFVHKGLVDKTPTSAGSDEANVISDIYGYALDLLFRTNASESKLKLQTTPVDRIYADNNNANTMGAGSTMTFTSTTGSFGEDKMISLIENIKIVFVDNTNTVLAHAILDTTKNDDGSKNYVVDNGQIICNIRLVDENKQMVAIDNQVLCPLTANTAKGISTIVYLDGTSVTNSDVANAATSMTATMNLQFSSTATLDPMDYSGLYIPQTGTDTGNQSGSGEEEQTPQG